MSAFIELFALFDCLTMVWSLTWTMFCWSRWSIAINNAAPSDLQYTLFCRHLTMAALLRVGSRLPVRLTRQLEIRADHKYFLPLLACYLL